MSQSPLFLLLDVPMAKADAPQGDLTRLMSKAVPGHLLPKKVVTKTGVLRTYYVRPYSGDQARRQVTAQLDAARTLRAWSVNPIADQLTPQDGPALHFLKDCEARANDEMNHDDWKDPVGEGPREIRTVTNRKVLSDIQKRLDDSEHELSVELVAAYELHYHHPGFDQAARDIGNVTHLYHGVNADRAAAVIATGLKSPKAVGSTTGQMFGPGIYFADDAGKSAQYIGVGGFGHAEGTGIMLECDVALGNMHGAPEAMRGLSAAGVPIAAGEREVGPENVDFHSVSETVAYLEQQQATKKRKSNAPTLAEKEILLPLKGAEMARQVFFDRTRPDAEPPYGMPYGYYETADDTYRSELFTAWAEEAVQHADTEVPFKVVCQDGGVHLDYDAEDISWGLVRFAQEAKGMSYADAKRIAFPENSQKVVKLLWTLQHEFQTRFYDAYSRSKLPAKLAKKYRDKASQVPLKNKVYHSVHGLKSEDGGSLRHNEFVVYDENQVKIRRVLLVKRSKE